MFPGDYKQQRYTHDGYSSKDGQELGLYMFLTPPLSSSDRMTNSFRHGPQRQTIDDFHSSASKGHNSSPFSHSSSCSRRMPLPTGRNGSSCYGATRNSSRGMPPDGYWSLYNVAADSPVGSKIESLKHDHDDYGHSSMPHSPMHQGHQSAEWELRLND
ncbi:hypothetical protein DCAR_0936146 [Daucus carota subsp. sativus]|uniref:Uncharacterized protein n=1 Tax=Daucus carota subsp. sativus TaxID=79200 RepID=A0A175YKC1_DAUCS|nr:hypothetical protein DCAR_0936146 [Daucus carota subsp. sativus]